MLRDGTAVCGKTAMQPFYKTVVPNLSGMPCIKGRHCRTGSSTSAAVTVWKILSSMRHCMPERTRPCICRMRCTATTNGHKARRYVSLPVRCRAGLPRWTSGWGRICGGTEPLFRKGIPPPVAAAQGGSHHVFDASTAGCQSAGRAAAVRLEDAARGLGCVSEPDT